MKPANTRNWKLFPILIATAIVLVTFAAMVIQAATRKSNTISVTVTNHSQRAIARLYLAVGDPNNWGPDQLHGSTVPSGGSCVLSDVACSGTTVRVIAEDQNGCFVYYNASCDSDQNWEIKDDTPPDCGG